MRFVLSLIVAVTVLGAIQASSEEIALGVSLTSVDNRVTVGSSRNDCSDGDWNTAAIKEGESESPEMTAVIENNREDRERTVVIDRYTASFVDIAILLFLLFAFMQAFQDRCAPWYQRGLIRKPLRKIGVILLHDVERCFVGEIAMVLGK
jgi:hypothetical protein